jgi:hypothetical protein
MAFLMRIRIRIRTRIIIRTWIRIWSKFRKRSLSYVATVVWNNYIFFTFSENSLNLVFCTFEIDPFPPVPPTVPTRPPHCWRNIYSYSHWGNAIDEIRLINHYPFFRSFGLDPDQDPDSNRIRIRIRNLLQHRSETTVSDPQHWFFPFGFFPCIWSQIRVCTLL